MYGSESKKRVGEPEPAHITQSPYVTRQGGVQNQEKSGCKWHRQGGGVLTKEGMNKILEKDDGVRCTVDMLGYYTSILGYCFTN